MSQPLYQLVYYSRNKVAGSPSAFAAEVGSILAVSRRNNALAGLTGALLFNAGCFAQVLEGPLDAIEATFERIQQDIRHGDVSLLVLEPIAERSFEHWAMGFVGQSEDHARRFAEISVASGFDPA
ncbi:BLUF domain-containing protein, partial [bacterium]